MLKTLKILTPVFIGLLIAWLFNPLVKKMQKHKIKRVVAVIICYIILIGVILIMLGMLIPLLYNEIIDLTDSIPELFDDISYSPVK